MRERVVELHHVGSERSGKGDASGFVNRNLTPVESHGRGKVIPAVVEHDESLVAVDRFAYRFLLEPGEDAVSGKVLRTGLEARSLVVGKCKVDAVLCVVYVDGAVTGSNARDSATAARLDLVARHKQRTVAVVHIDVVRILLVGKDDVGTKGVQRNLERMKRPFPVRIAVILVACAVDVALDVPTGGRFAPGVNDLESRA